jgi:predicted house-cleaning NTP pyrophosphatase (Maf/HAM1 superfamily)
VIFYCLKQYSNDYGRVGYKSSVDIIKQLSGNKAEDVSQYITNQISADQITILAGQLFKKTGKAGTYIMFADITSGNILMRYYYIVCAGWENTYLYVYAHVL